MTRKKKNPQRSPKPQAPSEKRPAPPVAPSEDQELISLLTDKLASVMHPELFLALESLLSEHDPRWEYLLNHALDDAGEPSPLLTLQPKSLNPPSFVVEGKTMTAQETAVALGQCFEAFDSQSQKWRARLTFHIIQNLDENICAALQRSGMGTLIGQAEEALLPPALQKPTDWSAPNVGVDGGNVKAFVQKSMPPLLAQILVTEEVRRALPSVDADEVDSLAAQTLQVLEVRLLSSAPLVLEVRAGERPWLPLASVVDALKRRLSGGLRVLGT